MCGVPVPFISSCNLDFYEAPLFILYLLNIFLGQYYLLNVRNSERELERGKGIEWRDVSTRAMILLADSHDVSLVKSNITDERRDG